MYQVSACGGLGWVGDNQRGLGFFFCFEDDWDACTSRRSRAVSFGSRPTNNGSNDGRRCVFGVKYLLMGFD